MKRKTYDKKLQRILNCQQFTETENRTRSLTFKVEKDINNTRNEMKKQELMSDKTYSKLKTTGAQLYSVYTQLYGLAEIHRSEIPLHPVLSIPGSS